MTKKLFLAAASVAALAFAGGAQADVISGVIGGVNFDGSATGAGPYLVASELTVSATSALSGTITATNDLKTDIILTNGASRDYLVSFTIVGAEADASTLALQPVVAAGATGNAGVSLVSAEGGVITYLVTVKADADVAGPPAVPGKIQVTGFTLTAGVEQEAKANITISGNVVALVGGSQIPFDTAKAVTAVSYAPFFTALKATASNAVAALPDYKQFRVNPTTTSLTTTLGSVQGISAAGLADKIHADLNGSQADVAALLTEGVVTVTGPLITADFKAGLAGQVVPTEEANTAVFKLNAAQAETFLTGGTSLTLTQSATAAKQAEIQAGSYTVSWAPKAEAGFTASSSSAAVGAVSLEGSNFYAPWVSGTGLATSVVRLSNNTNKPSGAVTVRLRNATTVTAGASAPFVTTAAPLVLSGVPAGGDLQITSGQLVAHFGEFTRGDLQITVNSADGAVTAKMRNTRDGQTFEQSLAAK